MTTVRTYDDAVRYALEETDVYYRQLKKLKLELEADEVLLEHKPLEEATTRFATVQSWIDKFKNTTSKLIASPSSMDDISYMLLGMIEIAKEILPMTRSLKRMFSMSGAVSRTNDELEALILKFETIFEEVKVIWNEAVNKAHARNKEIKKAREVKAKAKAKKELEAKRAGVEQRKAEWKKELEAKNPSIEDLTGRIAGIEKPVKTQKRQATSDGDFLDALKNKINKQNELNAAETLKRANIKKAKKKYEKENGSYSDAWIERKRKGKK